MMRIWKNFTSTVKATTGNFENTICWNHISIKIALRKICKFNFCFQMEQQKLFIMRMVAILNLHSRFKVVYHRVGTLLPITVADPKFLQIYFMGDEEQQIHTRCVYNHIEQTEEPEIVDILEMFLQNHNQLVRLFRTFSYRLQNDNYVIIIKADKQGGENTAPTWLLPVDIAGE